MFWKIIKDHKIYLQSAIISSILYFRSKRGEVMNINKSIELKILKAILWIYIILCLVIAGLNYGYANQATASVKVFITWAWHFYENWVKTFFILIGSFLTLRITSTLNIKTMRKRNLIGFIVSALIIHIIMPIFLNNSEVYFFTMPLPWTTTPLQLLHLDSSFYLSRIPIWGLAGVASALTVYVCISVIIIIGTLLVGRRWQCSTLCLFNGFASEVFEPAFPLVGKSKKIKPNTLKIFSCLRWVFLIMALFFVFYWILVLVGIPITEGIQVISKLENYKYLSTELLMAMFFWVAFIGRGYCYYCPLGTVLGWIGKAAGQKIITNNTKCIKCNKCNLACTMAIDIKDNAQNGKAVTDLRCVGCGHCVDACPTKNLSYSTKFLSRIFKKVKKLY
ncbi:MAG: 4Fe-4S ferredoxin [Clostridia bacterium]|jgi:polyferredoxin|nr:4Fe-4S ferredoxin [Clostridia bacterium]